jgi:hypothetical protein
MMEDTLALSDEKLAELRTREKACNGDENALRIF